MLLTTKEIKTKPSANRTFVIGFRISQEEYMTFMEQYKEEQEYQVEITPAFCHATKGQKQFFHRLLRKLSEKMRMKFEDAKQWFITEYGFPEETDDGYLFLYVDKAENPSERFKADKYYFKAIDETETQIKYLGYRGVSLMDSREMNLLLDFLKTECQEQGIKVMSDKEYAKQKAAWGKA